MFFRNGEYNFSTLVLLNQINRKLEAIGSGAISNLHTSLETK